MAANRFPRGTSVVERLLGTCVKTECGCWMWLGKATAEGRPFMTIDRKTKAAARVSFEEFNGPIPIGHVIRHTCDTPLCINPKHLITGTQQDNMNDMSTRGRGRGGGNGKLSDSDIQSILIDVNNGKTLRAIADRLGVDRRSVSYWVKKKAYPK